MSLQLDTAAAIRALLDKHPDIAALKEYEKANLLGISPALWIRLKRGAKYGLHFETIMRVCQAFDIEVEEVLRLGGMPKEQIASLRPYLRGHKRLTRIAGVSGTKEHGAETSPASGGGDEPPGSHYTCDIRFERDLRPVVITGLQIVPQFQGGGQNGSLPFVGDLLTMPRKSHNTKRGVSRGRTTRRRSKDDAWEGEGALAA